MLFLNTHFLFPNTICHSLIPIFYFQIPICHSKILVCHSKILVCHFRIFIFYFQIFICHSRENGNPESCCGGTEWPLCLWGARIKRSKILIHPSCCTDYSRQQRSNPRKETTKQRLGVSGTDACFWCRENYNIFAFKQGHPVKCVAECKSDTV